MQAEIYSRGGGDGGDPQTPAGLGVSLPSRREITEAKLSTMGETEPRGFPNRGGFQLFFGEGPDCVADPFGNVLCRCLIGREKGKGQIGEITEKIGKIPTREGKSQKRQKGQIGADKSKSGSPPFDTPSRLAALDHRIAIHETRVSSTVVSLQIYIFISSFWDAGGQILYPLAAENILLGVGDPMQERGRVKILPGEAPPSVFSLKNAFWTEWRGAMQFLPGKHWEGQSPSMVDKIVRVSETGSAKTVSAIDVRIDDVGSILNFCIGFSL